MNLLKNKFRLILLVTHKYNLLTIYKKPSGFPSIPVNNPIFAT